MLKGFKDLLEFWPGNQKVLVQTKHYTLLCLKMVERAYPRTAHQWPGCALEEEQFFISPAEATNDAPD